MELRDARIAGKTFMDVSVRVFQKKIIIYMGELSKAGGSLQRLWASSNTLSALKEQKGRRMNLLSLYSGIWFSSFLPQLGLITRPLIIWSSDSDWIIATSFPGSPAWRQQTMGLPGIHNTQSIPIISLLLFISLCILLVFVSLENLAWYKLMPTFIYITQWH